MADVSPEDSLKRLLQSGVIAAPAGAVDPAVAASMKRLTASGAVDSSDATQYDPSEGGGSLQIGPWDTGIPLSQGFTRFLAGAGKSFVDTAKGVRSAAADAASIIPGAPQSWKDTATAYRQEADAQKKTDAPLMNTGAGASGNLAGQVLQALAIPVAGEAGLARVAGSAAAGAAQAGMQPVGVNDSRTANALIGGAFGGGTQLGANTLGAIVRPAVSANAERNAAAAFAAANGADLTLAQRTGSPFAGRVEQILANLPGSRGYYAKNASSLQDLTNNVIADITGGDAGANIGKFGAGKTVTLDQPFFTDMRNIGGKFSGLADRDAPNSALKSVEQYVGTQTPNPALAGFSPQAKSQALAQGVPEFAPGAVTPKFQPGRTMPLTGPQGDFNNYWALRSLYGGRAFKASDPADSAAYWDLTNALDNTAMRSLETQGADPAALANLRAGYSVQRALAPAATVSPEGSVSYNLGKIGGLIGKKDINQPNYLNNLPSDAGGTLRDLANLARNVKPVNSSGTAENTLAGKVATLEILKDLTNPLEMLHSVVGLTGVPWLVNAGMQSTRGGVPALRSLKPGQQEVLNRLAAGGGLGLLGVAQSGGMPALLGN